MRGLRLALMAVALSVSVVLGTADVAAAAAPSPASHGPQVRVVRPQARSGTMQRVRVCHVRQVRRRDRNRRWHTDRVKVCHVERVRR
jgi:hypothetical protein